MDREAWWATVYSVTESDVSERPGEVHTQAYM